MSAFFINELTSLLSNDWYSYDKNLDYREERFKRLSFDQMTSCIDDLGSLLEKFKEIRSEKLESEIAKTTEKLERLKKL